MKRIWKPIPCLLGYYEASSLGEMRNALTKRILKIGFWGDYLYARAGGYGLSKTWGVHRFVAEAFLGSCPEGMEVNHKDGCKTNNCADNLEYVTPRGNIVHAFRMGLMNPRDGENNSNAKLTVSNVREIRDSYASRKILRSDFIDQFAERFEVPKSTIESVIGNRSWKNIRADNYVRKRLDDQRGENNPQAKITEDMVRRIKRLYRTGKYTQVKIAEIVGVPSYRVNPIVLGKEWKHVA